MNTPVILADHTGWHTLVQFLTSPTFLIVGGLLVAGLAVVYLKNRSAK